jgi:hypothetical protein
MLGVWEGKLDILISPRAIGEKTRKGRRGSNLQMEGVI